MQRDGEQAGVDARDLALFGRAVLRLEHHVHGRVRYHPLLERLGQIPVDQPVVLHPPAQRRGGHPAPEPDLLPQPARIEDAPVVTPRFVSHFFKTTLLGCPYEHED